MTPSHSQKKEKAAFREVQFEKLDEIVITGQHNAQSVKRSVFEVAVINRSEIEQRAANNLTDLLNQTLNITIRPNTSEGKSGVSLFGLDEQYFKILIDNIPVINEEGIGNNVDLTTINLDDVERVEIVEGSMGVQYGGNAVSGIINIITKKRSVHKTDIGLYIQEETVGKEYEWFDFGRHVQSIKIGHNLTEEIYGNISFSRNQFGGFWNEKKGEKYLLNDGLRGHDWLPKEQFYTKFILNYQDKNTSAFYKFEFFDEKIDKFNEQVAENRNTSTDTTNPSSLDEVYNNKRFIHHLNANGSIGTSLRYNLSFSYQSQTKDLETYTYHIREDQKTNRKKGEYLSRKAFFSRGTLSGIQKNKPTSLQIGYELTQDIGTGSAMAITIDPDEPLVSRHLNNYDIFISSETTLNSNTSIRPGARVSFANLFDPYYTFSMSFKQEFTNKLTFRTILGSANRTPNYNELFTYFKDINHDVQGNPNLKPERGFSSFSHLKKEFLLSNRQIRTKHKISLSYIDLKDRIELIVVNKTPLAYQYNNIDSYKSVGLILENKLLHKRFQLQLGVSWLGVSKILDRDIDAKDDFLYSLKANSNLMYSVPKWNTSFGIYFKYNGKEHQFVERENEQGDQEFQKGTTQAFSWLDITVKKSILNKRIETTFGVENLLDVNNVNTNAFSGGAHSNSPSNVTFGYGRSYFLKVAYNINS